MLDQGAAYFITWEQVWYRYRKETWVTYRRNDMRRERHCTAGPDEM